MILWYWAWFFMVRWYQLPQPAALITSANDSWPLPPPFHAALKVPQLNIFMLYEHASPSQIHSLTLSLIHSPIHSHTQSDLHNKGWICPAEEFLKFHGKVEAVVRNAPIGVFFHWYFPFPCNSKDFKCRSGVTLNPCISATNEDVKKSAFSLGFRKVPQTFQPSEMNRKYRSGQADNWYFWFYLQNGNFEPLYMSKKSRFWKTKKVF